MKTRVLILSLLCMLTTAVNADIVSVNFSKWEEADVAVDDGYGVEPADNWFELKMSSEPPRQGTDLTTSNGKTSTIDFTISGGEWDRFAWAPGGVGWFHTPMGSGIGSAGTVTLTISDIDGTFPNEYDVIVYVTGWGGWGAYTDGTTTYYCAIEDAMTGELIQCTDTDDSDGIDEGTYGRFNDLSADTAIIQIVNPIGGAIGGFQVMGSERAMAYSLSPTGVVSRDFDEHELTWISGDFPDDPNLTRSFDLLWKGLEVTTGAQREHRYDVLVEQVFEKGLTTGPVQFYLDFFKYGCPPHGGLGFGLARMLMSLLDLPNLREATFLFRGPNRLMP